MADEKKSSGTPPATRRMWGVFVLVLSVFVALSVFSYDWGDMALLRSPPNDPPCNLIGPLGAGVAFVLLMALGVGGYLVAPAAVALGLLLLTDRTPRVWPRVLWLLAAALSACLALQLRPEWWSPLCERLNLTDAGGVLGHLVTQRLLVRWLSPVGAAILIACLFVTGVVLAIEGHRFELWLKQLIRALAEGRQRLKERTAEPHAVKPETGRLILQDAPVPRKTGDDSEPDIAPLPAAPVLPKLPPKPKKKVEKPPEPGPEPEEERPPTPPERPAGTQPYVLPPVLLLDPVPETGPEEVQTDTEGTGRILVNTLKEFGIEVQVTNVEQGPVVTRYEVLPAPGIRVERIAALSSNLALSLKATSVRVQAPVPGKGVVGIEVPNSTAQVVYLRTILESDKWKRSHLRLPLALGKDVGGADLVFDLARMPHLLIAGATGSGKTVCMNAILGGLLMARTPEELRLLLVDPKIVEFSGYNNLPHLVVPVVTDPKKVSLALRWAINEMERRYKLFAKVNVRNIDSFNSRVTVKQEDLFGAAGDAPAPEPPKDDIPARVPYIVIVVDELADLMLTSRAEIENSIARLAQLSRAVGIHMIIATQRPSVNVITGTIKANFPARIAFQVAQSNDSRTILDTSGAEKLLGRGDLLFVPPTTGKLVRGQGAMVKDSEINAIVEFIRKQAPPAFEPRVAEELEKGGESEEGGGGGDSGEDSDELLDQAIEIIRETRRASTSSLQRRLRIGYNRAGRLMDVLERKGIVGPPRGSDPREILIDLDGDIPNNAAGSETDDGVVPEGEQTEGPV